MCQELSHELEVSRAYWLEEVNRLRGIMEQARAKLAQSRTAGTDAQLLSIEAENLLFETLYPDHAIPQFSEGETL